MTTELEGETVYYRFDQAMCGADVDLDFVADCLTRNGYPARAVKDSYNGAPSEEQQAEAGALIPPDSIFFEAVAVAPEND